MKRFDLCAICIVSCVLAGCANITSIAGSDTAVDETDPCGAQGYTSLLGTSLAAVTLPANLNDRVVRSDEAVTQDYDPTRLNLELNSDDMIVGLSCG